MPSISSNLLSVPEQLKAIPRLVLLLPAVLAVAAAAGAACATDLEIDPGKRYQPIDGFGTCLISWGEYPGQTYTPELARIYAEDMGLNILRCELSGGTLPEEVAPDQIDYRNFQLTGYTGAAKVFLDFAKLLKEVNPEVRTIGTVWTPPGWMKKHGQGLHDPKVKRDHRKKLHNNALTYGETENYVTKEYYPHFVAWLVQMAKMFEANGTPLSAAAIHNNFVHGHASAFVPWQISGAEPTTHNLMVRDTMTKKSQAIRHFARFIEEGAYRVAASPNQSDGLAASAYLHPETGDLAIVLINSSPRSRQIDLKIEGDRAFRILQITRTSAEEDFFDGGNVSLENGRAKVAIPPQCIVTLSGRETGRVVP